MKYHSKREYLDAALLSFMGFGLEILVIIIEAFFYGNANFREWSLFSTLIHWTITSLLWFVWTCFLYQSAKKKGFDLLEQKAKPSIKNIIIALGLLGICVLVSFIQWDFQFKVIAEWIGKWNTFSSGGAIAFLFQYIYYFAESFLILLTIAFGQKFGEAIYKGNNANLIPWGGFICGATWGLMHILTQDLQTGITLFILTNLYGIAYNLMKQNVRYAYFVIAMMFIL